MSLPPGRRLGPYEIISPIGAGGVGEVLKAKDTRLQRTVAKSGTRTGLLPREAWRASEILLPEGWMSFLTARDQISLKQAKRGLRAYPAVTGGIEVPEVMGSRSTYVGGRLGGLEGRALTKGDSIVRWKEVGSARRGSYLPISSLTSKRPFT